MMKAASALGGLTNMYGYPSADADDDSTTDVSLTEDASLVKNIYGYGVIDRHPKLQQPRHCRRPSSSSSSRLSSNHDQDDDDGYEGDTNKTAANARSARRQSLRSRRSSVGSNASTSTTNTASRRRASLQMIMDEPPSPRNAKHLMKQETPDFHRLEGYIARQKQQMMESRRVSSSTAMPNGSRRASLAAGPSTSQHPTTKAEGSRRASLSGGLDSQHIVQTRREYIHKYDDDRMGDAEEETSLNAELLKKLERVEKGTVEEAKVFNQDALERMKGAAAAAQKESSESQDSSSSSSSDSSSNNNRNKDNEKNKMIMMMRRPSTASRMSRRQSTGSTSSHSRHHVRRTSRRQSTGSTGPTNTLPQEIPMRGMLAVESDLDETEMNEEDLLAAPVPEKNIFEFSQTSGFDLQHHHLHSGSAEPPEPPLALLKASTTRIFGESLTGHRLTNRHHGLRSSLPNKYLVTTSDDDDEDVTENSESMSRASMRRSRRNSALGSDPLPSLSYNRPTPNKKNQHQHKKETTKPSTPHMSDDDDGDVSVRSENVSLASVRRSRRNSALGSLPCERTDGADTSDLDDPDSLLSRSGYYKSARKAKKSPKRTNPKSSVNLAAAQDDFEKAALEDLELLFESPKPNVADKPVQSSFRSVQSSFRSKPFTTPRIADDKKNKPTKSKSSNMKKSSDHSNGNSLKDSLHRNWAEMELARSGDGSEKSFGASMYEDNTEHAEIDRYKQRARRRASLEAYQIDMEEVLTRSAVVEEDDEDDNPSGKSPKSNKKTKKIINFQPADGCKNASDFIVRCFAARLRTGITVLKHNRSRFSKSQYRILQLLPDGKSLTWKPISGEKTKGKRPRLDLMHCLEVRHAWTKDPTTRKLTGTSILRKNAKDNMAAKSLSLIFKKRTLDMTALSTDLCKVLLEGFSALCFRLQMDLDDDGDADLVDEAELDRACGANHNTDDDWQSTVYGPESTASISVTNTTTNPTPVAPWGL